MTKQLRQYRILLAEHGCRILTFRQGRHFVFRCEGPHGQRFLLTAPVSPSDWRIAHRVRADIRRALATQAR